MPDEAETPDIARLRRPLRQRPALRDDPGRGALLRLAMLLARQAAAETPQQRIDARSPKGGSADNRTAARLETAAAAGSVAPNRAIADSSRGERR